MAEEDIETEGPPPEEASNRTFIILAVLLGGIFVLGLFCIGLYAVFIGPQQVARRNAAATIHSANTQTIASNTQAAATMTEALLSASGTEQALAGQLSATALAPTETETPVIAATLTNTPAPTETPAVTDTLAPPEATAAAETEVAGGTGGDVTPTNDPNATGTTIGGAAATPTRLATRTPTQTGGTGAGTAVAQVTTTGTPGTLAPPGTQGTGGGNASATPRATALPGTGFADDAGVPGLVFLGIALIGIVIIARRLRMAVR